jgi:hypothetical protein
MSNPVNGTIGGFWLTGGVGAGSAKIAPLIAVATVNVADPVGLTDGFGAMLSVTAAGRLRVDLGASPVPVQPPAAALVDSPMVSGRVVAPGAGAVITSITPAAGTYDIQIRAAYDLGAPVAAAETNNMAVVKQGVSVLTLQVLPVINLYSNYRVVRLSLNGAQSVAVNAIGAATAGVGYSAEIICIRVA